MNNEERAAIMLLSLDEDVAAEVMRNMRPQEIRRVGKYMNRITMIPAEVVNAVAKEFVTLAKENGGTIAIQRGQHSRFGQGKCIFHPMIPSRD